MYRRCNIVRTFWFDIKLALFNSILVWLSHFGKMQNIEKLKKKKKVSIKNAKKEKRKKWITCKIRKNTTYHTNEINQNFILILSVAYQSST